MEHRKKGCSPPHTYVWVKQCVNVEVTHITCWRNFDSFRSALGPLHNVHTIWKNVRDSRYIDWLIDWLIDLFISPLNIDCPCKAYVLLPANHKIDSVNQVLWLQPSVSIGVNQHPDHHHWRELAWALDVDVGCVISHGQFFVAPGRVHLPIVLKSTPRSRRNGLLTPVTMTFASGWATAWRCENLQTHGCWKHNWNRTKLQMRTTSSTECPRAQNDWHPLQRSSRDVF